MRLELIDLHERRDTRGSLIFGERPADVPFEPLRFFVVGDVPIGEVRGRHAHLECDQLLICIVGAVEVTLDDGNDRQRVVLNSAAKALRIPPGVWGEQCYLTEGARLLVLASQKYDPDDYISDYDAFILSKRESE